MGRVFARFFAGAFGITPVTIGGGTIADMYAPEKRGSVMAIWAMGPLLGPVIGPVAGGYLAGSLGWRYIFYILTAAVSTSMINTVIDTNPILVWCYDDCLHFLDE